MTDKLKNYAIVVTALAEGKKIQVEDDIGWLDWVHEEPPQYSVWDDFRVKPEPKRYRVWQSKSGQLYAFDESEESAEAFDHFSKWVDDWREYD